MNKVKSGLAVKIIIIGIFVLLLAGWSTEVCAKGGIKFSITSSGGDVTGYILSFAMKYNLEKARKHFLKLNKKGELYTWSFVKDNILLVLDGALTKEKAREFERLLYEIKK